MMETTVANILSLKASNIVWSVSAHATVREAIDLMCEKCIGAVLVIDQNEIIGLFTEHECVNEVLAKNLVPDRTMVVDVMKQQVLHVEMQTTAGECFALMTAFRVRHLPVIAEHRLAGLVSIGDVVKCVFDDQQFMLDQMARYYTGSHRALTRSSWKEWMPADSLFP